MGYLQHNHSRTRLFSIAFSALTFAANCQTLNVSSDQIPKSAIGSDKLGRPVWISTAKANSTSELNPSERQARSDLFEVLGAPALTAHALDDKNHPSGGGFDFDETLEPLPKAQSDAIVVGSVTAFQPFLTRNGSSVYTELTFSVDKIIKDSAETIQQGGSVTVLQRGGTLFIADQKVVNAVPYGGSNPIKAATRYLLFLKYHKSAQAYTVLRAWDLSGSLPLELDGNGHSYPPYTKRLEEPIASEAALLNYLKSH